MNKFLRIFICFFVFWPSVIYALKLESNLFMYNGSSEERFSGIVQTFDGGFLVAGTNNSTDIAGLEHISGNDAILVKYDKNFNIEWQNSYGTGDDDEFYDVIKTSDKNYVVVGKLSGGNVILKIDSKGNLIWEYKVPVYDYPDQFLSVVEDNDGNYILCGFLQSTVDGFEKDDSNYQAGIVMKFDSSGQLLWKRIVDDGFLIQFHNIMSVSDGYIVVGRDYSSEGIGAVIIKFTKNGDLVWREHYGTEYSCFYDSVERNDMYFTVGFTQNESGGYGSLDAVAVVFDKNGNVVMDGNFGGSKDDIFYSIDVTSDGGFLLSGATASPEFTDLAVNNQYAGFVVKVDNEYERVFMHSEFIDNYNHYYRALEISPSYYVAIGNVVSHGHSGGMVLESKHKAFLSKINIEYDVDSLPTFNGTFDVERVGDKGKITIKSNQGYEVGLIIIKDSKDNILDYYLGDDGNYYFDIYDDVRVDVKFKKILDEVAIPFIKDWSVSNEIYAFEDMMFTAFMFKSKDVYRDGFVISDFEIDNYLENGVAVSYLEVYDNDGHLLRKKELEDIVTINSLVIGDDIFVLCVNPNDGYLSILKFSENLEKVDELELNLVVEPAINFIIQFKLYGVDIFKNVDDHIYLTALNSCLEINSDLNIIDVLSLDNNDDVEKVCSLFPVNCYLGLFNEPIFGYDKEASMEVFSGGSLDGNRSAFITFKDNGQVAFEKKFDNYVFLANARFVGEYVVVNAFKNDDTSELLVLNSNGDIVQIINNGFAYLNLLEFDKGFIVLSVNYVNSCSADINLKDCLELSHEYYYLNHQIDIAIIGNGEIEIPEYAKAGEEVKFTVEPKFGYTFKGLKITDSEGNVTMVTGDSFIMPEGDVTIEPIFEVVNPNTGMFLSIGLIGILVYVVYLFKFSKKIKLKHFV